MERKSKATVFKMKSSPAKLFGFGKSARQKRARRYELEDREEERLRYENASLTGHTKQGNMGKGR